MGSSETRASCWYECQSKREHQAKWDTGLNGRQAEYEHQANIGARRAWTPGGNECQSKRECRPKRWLASGSSMDKPPFGWLVGLYKSRLLRGCPNRLFGIIAVDKEVNRFVPRCSGGGRRFEGWHRVYSALLRLHCFFLRLLSHLFKVRPIRFSHGAFYRTFKCNQVASLARRFRGHSVCAGYAVSQGCSDVAEIVQRKFISSNAPSSAGGRCLIGKNKKSIQAVSQQYLETSR